VKTPLFRVGNVTDMSGTHVGNFKDTAK